VAQRVFPSCWRDPWARAMPVPICREFALSAVPLDLTKRLGDDTSPSGRAGGVQSLDGSLPSSRPGPAPVVHAELFIDRLVADGGDADATACGDVVADALAAAAAYVGDCLVPAERPKAWDYFSPQIILRVPDGSVWVGWPSREEFRDSGPNVLIGRRSANNSDVSTPKSPPQSRDPKKGAHRATLGRAGRPLPLANLGNACRRERRRASGRSVTGSG
jgi:hypothetical protein